MLMSTQIAIRARERFALTKAIVLESVLDGTRTATDAIATLERNYRVLAIDFLKDRSHARSVWEQHGPLVELTEVHHAHTNETAWAALLERVRKAREERTAHER